MFSLQKAQNVYSYSWNVWKYFTRREWQNFRFHIYRNPDLTKLSFDIYQFRHGKRLARSRILDIFCNCSFPSEEKKFMISANPAEKKFLRGFDRRQPYSNLFANIIPTISIQKLVVKRLMLILYMYREFCIIHIVRKRYLSCKFSESTSHTYLHT